MIAFVAVRFVLLLQPAAAAHELEAAVSLAAPAVIVHAAYGGSEPVPFAKVQVFSPAAAAQEFQSGFTDRRGCFSFVPDGPGALRVVVDDEQGHRREVTVHVPHPFAAVSGLAAAAPSRLERALAGIAIIFGATGFLYGFKVRRTRSQMGP